MCAYVRYATCMPYRAQVTNPIEPLMVSLMKSFVDDDDLKSKLTALYQVENAAPDGGRAGMRGIGWVMRKISFPKNGMDQSWSGRGCV
jgi:hypothetical protein